LKKSKRNTFKVKLSRKAEKFLDKLQEKDRERILTALRTLREDPFTLDIKKLEGTEFHRIRVGRLFRIIIMQENLSAIFTRKSFTPML